MTPPSSQQSPFDGEKPDFPVTRPDYSHVKASRARQRKNLAMGLAFLAPNIVGFLTFTAIPLVIAMVMAFTNWDLRLHNNPEESAPLRFVGLEHFFRLLNWNDNPDFYRFLGNTLFLMMGMPFTIAASLGSAILLSKDLKGGSRKAWTTLVTGAAIIGSTLVLCAVGLGGSGMTILFASLTAFVLIAGTMGGTTIYRTLFYVPHFTAGVATLLLWKKLYNPQNGPITNALVPVLSAVSGAVNALPPGVVQAGFWICVALVVLVLLLGMRRIRIMWEEGDLGVAGAVLSVVFLLVPILCAVFWYGVDQALTSRFATPDAFQISGFILVISAFIALAITLMQAGKADKTFVVRKNKWHGVGSGIMYSTFLMTGIFILVGIAAVLFKLPLWAADGLDTPGWLNDVHWAKPSMMMMGFWLAVGSNTMLLYLAALTNVPQELYEAADIDGATRFQQFWNVTWPQLAPTTFFTVVMGIIGGLQGGFESARVLTKGGPAGQTTTLSYFIYTEGFETGRLGFSSAVAWTLFVMVLLVTLFNWKFGNKYVND